MIRLIENDIPWKNGYAFACVRNTVVAPGISFIQPTKAGKCLYLMRVKNDYSVLSQLVDEIVRKGLVQSFFKDAVIVPLPPSKERAIQPVSQIAQQLSTRLNVLLDETIFPSILVDTTSPISKNETHKTRHFDTMFIPSDEQLGKYDKKQRFILFDDYYDTSKTMRAAASTLKDLGYDNIDIFTVCITQRSKKRVLSNKGCR